MIKSRPLTIILLMFCAMISAGCGGGGSGGSANPVAATSGGVLFSGRLAGEGDLGNVPVYLVGVDAQVPPLGSLRAATEAAVMAGQLYFAVTDGSGAFAFQNVTPGYYNLVARKDRNIGGIRRNLAVGLQASTMPADLELLLTATGEINGQVAVPADFSGSSGVVAFVPGTSYAAYTDENGAFAITGVPVGSYSVLFSAPGLAKGRVDNISVGAAQATTLPLITLSRDNSFFIGITWKGTQTAHPASPQPNWAYYNSTDKKAYIFDGSAWQILAESITGPQGPAGANGVSIAWQGSLPAHPATPTLNWAYYNTADGKSYIYNGTSWQVLASDGQIGPQGPAGISLVWKGTLASPPATPQMNWAYYNSLDKKAYIFDGSAWQILIESISGPQGQSGTGIAWQGTFFSHPVKPQLNWAYYNPIDGVSYIWNGSEWCVMSRDGNSSQIIPNAFISVWDTRKTSEGSSDSDKIKLPLTDNGVYSFEIHWGDGSKDLINNYNQLETTHTYAVPGEYKVTIIGDITGWQFNNEGDKEKLIEIQQFGNLRLGNRRGYFFGCTNLRLTAKDHLDLTGTTDLAKAFRGCKSITTSPGMPFWDVRNVTSMQEMFKDAENFIQDISSWNVGKVKNMHTMFSGARSFNCDIGSWNVSNVDGMSHMFSYAESFNQNISNWDVSKVTSIYCMFLGAERFNQPIGSWNVGNVTTMNGMFRDAKSFDQDISGWNVSQVTDMQQMFMNTTAFNQDIGNWDVGKVTSMDYMFYGAKSFNQSLANWNTAAVTSMHRMFYGAGIFNQNIGSWDVGNVRDMSQMFYLATSFGQNLGNWNVRNVTTMSGMFIRTSLSTLHYDNILIGWAGLPVQNNVEFDVDMTKFSTSQAAAARETLIGKGWIIRDGGQQ